MNPFDLTGKAAVVTGGNGGIGFAIARGLGRAGASVCIAGRDATKTAIAAKALADEGIRALPLPHEATDEHSCKSLIAGAAEAFGRLDILVNNAGSTIRSRVAEMTLEDWHKVQDTNTTAAFLCAREAHPHFVAAGGGKVICIGSLLSNMAAPVAAAYGASKGALVQFTRAIAVEWAKDNIQANAILPGWIETELTWRGRPKGDGFYERIRDRTPASRWGAPADLAGLAVFLASPASDFVTGAAILVDGGYSVAV
jgi:2-deoxy-D-gluconate 3-dehydrogenase